MGEFNIPISDDPLQNTSLQNNSSLNNGLDFGTSLDPDFNTPQSGDHTALHPEFSGRPVIPVYDGISHDSVLYQFPDVDGFNNYGQMPSVVCFSSLICAHLLRLFRTHSSGLMDLILLGLMAFSTLTLPS